MSFLFFRVEDGCWSRDEGHPNDEDEAFNFTSLSDAMIDDEIADQPNLVMLGQVGLLLLFLSFPVIFISFLFDSHCWYQHHRCARTCSVVSESPADRRRPKHQRCERNCLASLGSLIPLVDAVGRPYRRKRPFYLITKIKQPYRMIWLI